MSGGEPSSIKQKPSCAADLPILSPKCGKAAGCVYSNYLCAVLWGAERISIETTSRVLLRRNAPRIECCRRAAVACGRDQRLGFLDENLPCG